MRYFMYVIFTAALLAAYVSSPDVHLMPSVVKFFPDLVSALSLIYIVIAGAHQQFRYVNIKYWLIFGALTLALLCGPLVNGEAVGPIVNGMRYYLRAIPMFFLPAVVKFSERDIRHYLKFLLGLSLLQAPVAIYQRLTSEAVGIKSGDPVFGTLMSSGILSIFLIAVLCVMAGLMLRGRISRTWFGVCFVALMIPMSINETKMTVFVLPVTLLVTFLVAAPWGRKLIVTMQALFLLIVAGIIFVPIYDYYNKDVPGQFSVEDFLTNSGEFAKYMDRKAKIGTSEEAGRMDSLRAPFIALSNDPIKLFFGLGLGNASQSSLGQQYTGHYQPLYWNFVLTLSITAFLFELGLFGTGLVFILLYMLLRDALFVAKRDDTLTGAIALGYIGAWLTITIGLFYLTIHAFEALSFTFFFFSGLVAARREQLAMSRAKVRPGYSADLVAMKPKAG
jgi:hypothetical protein